MNNPIVSVAMVVCNVERFLAEAIESVLNQTFTNFELVIVDFGSTDNTRSIVRSFAVKDSRIIFREVPMCGLSEARNASCSLARGKYIAIMDADDICLKDRLALQVDFLEKHPDVGLVGGATEWIDASGKSLHLNAYPSNDEQIRSMLETDSPFCQPTVLMRKEAFTAAGGYRMPFAPAEDYDLWLRIVEHFRCANLEKVVLKYRVHPAQVSCSKRRDQSLRRLAALASASLRRKGQEDKVSSIGEITPAVLVHLGIAEKTQHTVVAREYLGWIRNMCEAGEYASALQAARNVMNSTDVKHAEKWPIADIWLELAHLYRREGDIARTLHALCRGVVVRPAILGRPLKRMLHHLRPRNATKEARGYPLPKLSVASLDTNRNE